MGHRGPSVLATCGDTCAAMGDRRRLHHKRMHEHHRIKPKASQIQKDTITDDYCMRRLFASAFGSSSSSSTTRTSGGNPRNMLKRPAQVPSDGDNSNACKMRKIVHTNVSWPDGHLPDGPIGIERQFEFGQVLLERMETFLGKAELCSRLSAWDWHVNTTFTGVSCAENSRYSYVGARSCLCG